MVHFLQTTWVCFVLCCVCSRGNLLLCILCNPLGCVLCCAGRGNLLWMHIVSCIGTMLQLCAVHCCMCSRGNLLWGQTGWDHATTVSGDEGKAFVVSFLSTFIQFENIKIFLKMLQNITFSKWTTAFGSYFNILLPIRAVSFSDSISQNITCLACSWPKRGPPYCLLSCLWFKHPSKFHRDFYQPKL